MVDKNVMSLCNAIINKNYKDALLNELSKINNVHIKSKQVDQDRRSSEEKDQELGVIKKLRQNLNNLFHKLKINELDFQNLQKVKNNEKLAFNVIDLHDLIKVVEEEINFYANRINELDKYIAKAEIELENIQVIKTSYTFLEQFNLNRDSLVDFTELSFKVFTTFTKNMETFKSLFEFSSFPNIHQTDELFPNVYKLEDRTVFYIIYPKEKELELKERLKLIFAEEVPILKKYLTPDGINFTRINSEIEIIKDTLLKYNKERERLREQNIYKFAAINEIVQNVEEYHWADQQFENLTSDRVLLRFFIPTFRKKEIEKDLLNYFKNKIMIETIDIPKYQNLKTREITKPDYKQFKSIEETKESSKEESKEKDLRLNTPTIMKNKWFIRPFETLTKMYGTPAYSEVDPTPFLALTFPLLFGLMFGDIGHGMVLMISGILGAIIFRKKKGLRNFSWIIFYCGIGAAFSGFLYGEFFGSEKFFGIELKRVSFFLPLLGPVNLYDPIHNIMAVFMFTLFIGVVHINLGWVIQFINYWKQKKRFLAITDSLIKIGFITGGAILIFQYGINIQRWLTFPYPILMVIIPGILLIILKPVGGLIGISYLKQHSFGALMGEGTVETFETALSVLSNVASYIRLLALALVHIALMIAIQTMINLIQGEGVLLEVLRLVGLIFGNIVVILLEGILAFINAIRLHFYEFFFKFYQGSGTEFFPFYLDNNYSIILFKKEFGKDIISEEIEKEIETRTIKEDVEEAIQIIEKQFLKKSK